MRICFDIASAANPAGRTASLREQTRFAVLAYTMQEFCEVCVRPSMLLQDHERGQFFRRMSKSDSYDYLVTSEMVGDTGDVIIKVSEGVRRDRELLERESCKVLVAHEHNSAHDVDNHPKLLPVPWPIYETTVDALIEADLFFAYLTGDLTAIREVFATEPRIPRAVFIGTWLYGREKLAARVPQSISDIILYGDNKPFSPQDYLKRVGQYAVGYDFPGNTPKTNRFSDLVMLGVVVARTAHDCPVTPSLTPENSVLMDCAYPPNRWRSEAALQAGIESHLALREAADRAWHEGWGPRGTAKLIYERLAAEGRS